MDRVLKQYNAHIEDLRRKEYPLLLNTTYLDHAGTTLYARSLIDAYHEDLTSNLYGNPHSACPASHLSTERVDKARLKVLEYFNADPEYFDVIFTANATASIKLVADCFRDQGFWYGYHRDAHSSIVGVREIARAGSRCFVSDEEVEDWIENLRKDSKHPNLQLFAYPAQSNMTGHRAPLSWSARIREACQNDKNTPYILLDAASYLTSGRLDLSNIDTSPDFIALSFYKIFGFPDLGALLVRKTAFEVMTHRRYFGGGTVDQVTVIDRAFHATKQSTLHDFLEDGTLPFHNIVALEHAIRVHQQSFGSAMDISIHTAGLAAHLYAYTSSCRHANGAPVVEVYKDENSTYGDPTTQGPIFAFSIRRSDGTYVGKSHFEKLAIKCGFQIRTGGVCNPGGIATMLNLNHWELRRNFTEGVRCGDDVDVVGGKPTGIIRVSLGPMSTMSDMLRFTAFLECFFVEKSTSKISSIQSKAQQHQSLTNGITPLRGCNRVHFEGIQPTAYNVWNDQWSILEVKSRRFLTSALQLHNLKVNIDLEAEELVFSHHDDENELRISIWALPPEREESPLLNGRFFDIYQEPHIAEWFVQHLGSLYTLTRSRQEDIRKAPEMTTCVVSSCLLRHKDVDSLQKHYQSHGEEFLRQHPFHNQTTPSRPKSWGSLIKKSINRSLSDLTIKPSQVVTANTTPVKGTDNTLRPKSTYTKVAPNGKKEKSSQSLIHTITLRSEADLGDTKLK